jgi:hypothetical protein
MTVKPENKKPAPEAQLQSFIDRFDPKNQKVIDDQAAVRKRSRPPTPGCVRLRQPSYRLFTDGHGIRNPRGARRVARVCVSTSWGVLNCPTRRSF